MVTWNFFEIYQLHVLLDGRNTVGNWPHDGASGVRNCSPLSLFRPCGNRGPLSATLQTEIDDWKRVEFGFDFSFPLLPPPSPPIPCRKTSWLCAFSFSFFSFISTFFPPRFFFFSSIYFPESHLKKNKQKKTQFYMHKYSVAPPWGGCWILKARGGTKVPN